MNTIMYVILVAFCTVLVYSFVQGIKIRFYLRMFESKLTEIFVVVLIGFVLAGMLLFFFKYLAIPLLVLGAVYYFVIRLRR